MLNPAPKGNAPQISDLRAQLKAQRAKRAIAAKKLRATTSRAAKGTPSDSKIFRLFDHASVNDNGNATPQEAEAVAEHASKATIKSTPPCEDDLIEARRIRKACVIVMKKTTIEVVAFQTRRVNKRIV